MSLKSRKSIDKAGPDNRDETVVTFRKEADKTYTKVTKTMTRDWKTGQVKKGFTRPIEDGPYTLVQEHAKDFDEKVAEKVDSVLKLLYVFNWYKMVIMVPFGNNRIICYKY